MTTETFKYDVFISYSSADKDWVRKELLPAIEKMDLKVCIDFRDFERGAPSVIAMEQGIIESRKTLLVLTPAYLMSAWTEFENLLLQTLDPANRNRRLIPLLKKKCELPTRISYLTYIDFVDMEIEKLAWDQLFVALSSSLEKEELDISTLINRPQIIEVYLERLESAILLAFQKNTYIELSSRQVEKEDQATISALANARTSPSFRCAIEHNRNNSLPVSDAISSSRRVILLGEPGIGKTTELRKSALTSIEKYRVDEEHHLPLLVSLANWDNSEIDAEQFIWRELLATCGGGNITFDEYVAWLYSGKLFLFLDGLNELPQRKRATIVNVTEKEHKYIHPETDPREESLYSLVEKSQSSFVITCRTNEYSYIPGWRVFEIMPLSDAQIEGLIRNHLAEESEAFYAAIKNEPNLNRICNNPFLLRSLIQHLMMEGSISVKDRFELVRYICRSAIQREAQRVVSSSKVSLNVLGEISFLLMKKGSIGSRFTLGDELWDGKDNKQDKQSINDAIQVGLGSGVIIGFDQGNGNDLFVYRHQLIQEALALEFLETDDSNESLLKSKALITIGRIHLYWGLLSEADDNFARAYELVERPDDEDANIVRAIAVINRSKICRYSRITSVGKEYAEHAVEILSLYKPSSLLADAYHELGEVYTTLKVFKKAEQYYTLALKTRKVVDSILEYADEITFGLADFYGSAGLIAPSKAFSLYHEALDIYKNKNQAGSVAMVNLNMAHLYRFIGNMGMAKKLFEQCDKDFEALGDSWGQLRALEFLGITLRDIKHSDEALEVGYKTLSLAKKVGSEGLQISILIFNLAWVVSDQKKSLEALEYVKQAYLLAREQKYSRALLDVYKYGYGIINWKARNFSEAAKYFLKANEDMDNEYRLHLGIEDVLAILWAKHIGIHVGKSILANLSTELIWLLYLGFVAIHKPTHWIGRIIWKLGWWSKRFVWMK